MIEQLATLLQNSNATQAQLNIRVDANGLTSVVLNVSQAPATGTENKEALALRALLMRPIVITGDKGAVDVEMVEELTRYSETYIEDANRLNSLPSANKVTVKKTTKAVSTPKAETPPETVVEPVKVTDFSSDEADSL
jgi:hypothetical protein